MREMIFKMDFRDKEIVIFTDSLSNLLNLSSPKSEMEEEEERLLHMLIRRLVYQNKKVCLHFVKGHDEYPGNELADFGCT